MNEINNFLKYQMAVDEKWEGWSFVEPDKEPVYGIPTTRVSEAFNREEMVEWCKERCKGDWVVMGGTVMLKDPRDAMLFKLTFSENYAKVK